MLPKHHRFHGPAGFRWVYSGGRSAHGRYLIVRIREQHDRPFQVAVVVSRKVHKSAVVRNRIRRRVYEAVRPLLATNDGPAVIVTVRDPSVQMLPMRTLQQEIRGLLSKVREKTQANGGRAIVKKEES